MDGRIHHEPTPEGRLAAVVLSVAIQMRDHEKTEPDYADYEECLRPFLQRELILARMQELQKATSAVMTVRLAELARELVDVSVQIAHMSDRFHL